MIADEEPPPSPPTARARSKGWKPKLGKTQMKMFNSSAPYILSYGERATGKTHGLLHKGLRHGWENPNALIPKYPHDTDAGLDLTGIEITKQTRNNIWIDTVMAVEIPKRYVGLIFPRSSITKTDMALGNSVGIIDSDFRGSLSFRFNIINNGEILYKPGDRVGQLIIIPYPKIEIEVSDDLSETERGDGGFGSTDNETMNVDGVEIPLPNEQPTTSLMVDAPPVQQPTMTPRPPNGMGVEPDIESAYNKLQKIPAQALSTCPVCDGTGQSGYFVADIGVTPAERGSIERCPRCNGKGRL